MIVNKKARFFLLDRRLSTETKIRKSVGIIILILGIMILISALPQSNPSIIDLGFIKINIGNQLDIIRLIMGFGFAFVGYKMFE